MLGPGAPPHWEANEKGHGRLEYRAVWMVSCQEAMQQYLAQGWGWPGVQWCGYILRRRLYVPTWEDKHRWHVRGIGPALSSLRSLALTLLCHIPDAQRIVSAIDDNGLALLTTPLSEH